MNIFFKMNIKLGMILAVVFTFGLFVMPRVASRTRAEVCSPLYDRAIFNPYPISSQYYSGQVKDDCTDFPTLAVRNVNNNSYQNSLTASAGDEMYVQVYIHNGGRQDMGDATKAFNVNAYITVDGNSEPEHVMGVTVTGRDISGSSISPATGSVRILTGPNDRLEVVPGSGIIRNVSGGETSASVSGESFNVNLGDQNGCFEYARFIQFKVRVVGATPVASGSISAQAGNRIGDQCLRTGTVTWTSNVNSAQVYVKDLNTGVENLFSGDTSGSGRETPWLVPGRNVLYTLYNTENSQKNKLDDYTLSVPDLNCLVEVVNEDKNFTLTADTSMCVGQQTRFTITGTPNLVGKTIVWSSTKNGVNTGENNPYSGQTISNSSGLAFWSDVSSTWQTSHIGNWTKTATIDGISKTVSFEVKDCDINPPGRGQVNFFNAAFQCPSNSVISWSTSNLNNVKVYVKSSNAAEKLMAAEASAIKNVNWMQINDIYTFTLRADGVSDVVQIVDTRAQTCGQTLTCPSGAVNLSLGSVRVNEITYATAPSGWHSGSFASSNSGVARIVGSQIYGVSAGNATISGSNWTAPNGVTGCGLTPVNITVTQNYSAIICSPISQTVNVNQTAYFSASGGGNYTWIANGGVQTYGSGQSFNTSFTSPGNYSVVVSSNGQNASCNIQVNSISQGSLICSPSSQSVAANQVASFSASGGSGSYTWYAPNSSQASGSGSYFHTSYSQSVFGSQTVIVSSGSQTANCNVQITSVPQSLICSPANQSVNTNQTANFTASGGSGSYTWSASNGSPSTGNGVFFSTSFVSAGNYSVIVQSGGQSQTCNITVNSINPSVGSLNINKQVKNISQSGSFGKTTNADNGNRVAYQIIITAQNNPVNNVVVSENLPSNFSYINGTLRLDSSTISDSQINSISLGNMTAGQSRTVYLEGYTNAYSGQCQSVITNTANVSGTGASTVSDSATIYVNQSSGCGGGGYSQMSITKLVRNSTSGNSYYSKNVNAQNSDRVQFEITVRNTGTQNLNNVRVRDNWNAGMSLVSGSVSVDGSYSFGNNIIDSDLSVGSLSVGQQKRITLEAVVFASGGGSLQNTARATADNASQVSDDAWVFINNSTYNPCPFGCVSGGNVNLSFQKRAINETKNTNAVSVTASREDYITYTLTVTNNGNAPANNFVITDDLSGVLNYADITDKGGGSVSGSTINFPGITVPAYGSVSKSFKVRVKYNLSSAGSFTINNTYGNTVSIRIGNPIQPAVLGTFVAPKTGVDSAAFVFSGVLTAVFAIYKKRKAVMSLID